jgi:diketogulonate reductase-like aldo/keto reductase
MRTRRFGPLDVEVPVIGIGTWQMETDDREAAIRAIQRAIELGMTHLDTAELYGRGDVEELVGEALVGHRGHVFLASKVMPSHATYAGTLRACELSLRRLRTDHLDLYLLHWREQLPLAETLRALQTLKKDGKIAAWAVSNFDVADLEEAIALVGEKEIACNQVLYHLDERDSEHVLQVFCARHHIAFVGYSPLGSGRFPRAGTKEHDVLARIGRAHGVGPHAVALAFLTRNEGTFTLPKSSRVPHVEALARAGSLVLTPEDVAAIDAAFPLRPPRSELPTI